MTTTGNRIGVPKTRGLATLASAALAACLGIAGCSGADDTRSTETNAEESIFARVPLEEIISTDKIRNGVAIDYDDGMNGVVWVRNGTGSSAARCTAQVINRFFLLTTALCVNAFNIQNTTSAEVMFTLSNGTTTAMYNGPAQFKSSEASAVFGLIFLKNGMSTCHNVRSVCANQAVNTPENAAFQIFFQGSPTPTWPEYSAVGYGPTSNSGTNYGVYRYGIMSRHSHGWNGSGNTLHYRVSVKWTLNVGPRPCPGDTGGPLIPFVQNRALHTGIYVASGNNCDLDSGNTPYYALSNIMVTNWLFPTMQSFWPNPGAVPFRCGFGVDAAGLGALHCANDQSMY